MLSYQLTAPEGTEMNKAQELKARKLDAIKSLHEWVEALPKEDHIPSMLTGAIHYFLDPIVSSAKWSDAVSAWCNFIREYPDNAMWAYQQGSVYFGYRVF